MGKFAALLVLLSVAALIYFFKPETSSIITDNQAPQAQDNQPTKPIPAPASAPPAQTQQLQSLHEHDHDHADQHQESTVQIPEFIQKELEAKRIPASELKQVEHPDGSVSMDLKGQYQHVPVAVLGEDGKITIIEKVIEPLSDNEPNSDNKAVADEETSK